MKTEILNRSDVMKLNRLTGSRKIEILSQKHALKATACKRLPISVTILSLQTHTLMHYPSI